MYFAPYFLIAFAVNFGLLAALGWASNESLWAQDARLLGCMGYSALVALVFALTGLQRTVQTAPIISVPVNEMTPQVVALPVRESLREEREPLSAMQHPPLRPNQKSPAPEKGELVT